MTLTMGFIGFGKSANRYHLPYVNTRKNIKVKTIFVRQINEELAAPYKSKGVCFTTDLDELLNDKEIQVVTICTPAHTHYELAKSYTCWKIGYRGKPFCDTVEHAKELLALGREKV